MANFLYISPNQTEFFPSVCLVPAGLFCHSCCNRCSLFKKVINLYTVLLDFNVAKWAVSSLTHLCGIQHLSAPSCFCPVGSFCFWEEVSNSRILNDIGRNSLLANRKKIAKFLMRTFTCRSTFLYVRRNCRDYRVIHIEYQR